MVDLRCSGEVAGIIAYATATGVPLRVTSTLRPGALTASGFLSNHARGLAVDFAGPVASWDSPALAAVFNAFIPVEKHLAELIYAGPQVSFNIKDGRRVGKYAQAIHHNHVHVAVRAGVYLDRAVPTISIDPTVEVAPDDDDEREDMAEPMDAMAAPGGGVWVLTRDGGVRAYRGAPFHGSYPGLPAELRRGTRTFVEITERDDDLPGYMLVSNGDERYRFPL